jgi:hypothetical protein
MTALHGTSEAALECWRQADARAREYETRLAQAWKVYEHADGPVPSEQLFAEVALFRELAHQKLSELLQVMRKETSSAVHAPASVHEATAP